MPLRVFANPASLLGYTLTFHHGIILNWLSFFLPVYFQVLLDASPLSSGVDLLAIVIPLALVGMVGGIVVAVTDRYNPLIITGFILLCIAIGCLTTFTADSSTVVSMIFQILVSATTLNISHVSLTPNRRVSNYSNSKFTVIILVVDVRLVQVFISFQR